MYPTLASYLLGGCGRDIKHALCSADYKIQSFVCSNQLDPLLEQFFAFVRLKSATQIPSFKIFFILWECLNAYLCAMCVFGAIGGQKKHQFPGPGVTDSCEPLCKWWELNPVLSKSSWCSELLSHPSAFKPTLAQCNPKAGLHTEDNSVFISCN